MLCHLPQRYPLGQPDLGLIPYKGSLANNIFDSGRWLQSVVYVPPHQEPDDGRRYKMIAWDTGGYQVAFSADWHSLDGLSRQPGVAHQWRRGADHLR